MAPYIEIEGGRFRELAKGEHVVELDEGKTKVSVFVETEGGLVVAPEEDEIHVKLYQGGTLILDPTDQYRRDEGVSFRGFTIKSRGGDEKQVYYIHSDIADVLEEQGLLEVKKPDTEKSFIEKRFGKSAA